ncbi:MAG: hypothetical protein ACOX5J_05910 [Candidatus Hydrogenedentales bacterium]|jgi:hypothetical protein
MCRGGLPRIFRYLAFLSRALHIYPDAIFKFDFAEALGEPNCIPSAGAMQWVLPIGDRACVFPPDNTEAGTFASAELLSPNEPCTTTLARVFPWAQSVVRYIHVSALLAGTPDAHALSDSADATLRCLLGEVGADCPMAPRTKRLSSLFGSHGRTTGSLFLQLNRPVRLT